MRLERIEKRQHPHLFDRVIGYVQDGLAANCAWLDHVFGRCERLVKVQNGQKYFTPNWYRGKREYLLLTPDQRLGNYCFFVMDEPQQVTWSAGETSRLRSPFSLIVWVDIRTIDEHDERDTEKVKEDVLHVLNGQAWIREGSISVARIYERAENVFQGFTMDEVDNQFMMSPFAAYRFDGEMRINNACI